MYSITLADIPVHRIIVV